MKITEENWPRLKRNYQEVMKKSHYCSISTVNEQGIPNITPIGSLVLNEKGGGFFFEIYPELLGKNIENNPNICVLFINTGMFYWFRSLYKGKFVQPVGFKLLGTARPKRTATSEEIAAFRNYIKPLKPLKGYHILWGDCTWVREVEFTDYFPINTGKMTATI